MSRAVMVILKIILFLLIRNVLCNNEKHSKYSRYSEKGLRGMVRSAVVFGSIKRSLSVCSTHFTESYRNSVDEDSIDEAYTKEVVLNNGTISTMHLIHDFRHNVKSMCMAWFPKYSLVPLRYQKWTLFENGTLLRQTTNTYLSPKEYCFDIHSFVENNVSYSLVYPLDCALYVYWSVELNRYVVILSVAIIVLTIVLFCCANIWGVYGKCVISYLISLLATYTFCSFFVMSDLQLSSTTQEILLCFSIYVRMCSLAWTCVISYEIQNMCTNANNNISFKKYCLMGWLAPLLMTFLICLLNTFFWSKLTYAFWYFSRAVVVVYGITTYIRVHRYIKRCEREVRPYTEATERVFLNFRLFLFTCFSWLCDILAIVFLIVVQRWDRFYFTINTWKCLFQALFIFLLLICQKAFWRKIGQRRKKPTVMYTLHT